jgi:hypothetical protein
MLGLLVCWLCLGKTSSWAADWRFWKRDKTASKTEASEAFLPVADQAQQADAQTAEASRLEAEKKLIRDSRHQGKAENKRQAKLKQDVRKRRLEQTKQQKAIVTRQRQLTKQFKQNQKTANAKLSGSKPSFFKRLFSRKPASDSFFIPQADH